MKKHIRLFIVLQVLILIYIQTVSAAGSSIVSRYKGATSDYAKETETESITKTATQSAVAFADAELLLAISNSRVLVSMSVTEQEAAERLGYLGIISGSGTSADGQINYDTERNVTRLEAYVLLSRLLGVEGIAQESDLPHHFVDVPQWGKAYVGYFVSAGLIQDVLDGYFDPDGTVSTNEFMVLMYTALGFSVSGSDYTLNKAAEYGMKAGICEANSAVLTRGAAFKIILRTLQTNICGKSAALANYLVDQGVFEELDIYYYVFCTDKALIRGYLYADNNRSVSQKETDSGVFAIMLNGTIRPLNLAAVNAQNVTAGIEINTYYSYTADATQKWRLICDTDGLYSLYTMANGNGYAYALGFNADGKCILCERDSSQVAKFYMESSGENYKFLSAGDRTKALSSRISSTVSYPPVSLQTDGRTEYYQTWKLVPITENAENSLTNGLSITFPTASTTTAGTSKVSSSFTASATKTATPVTQSAVIRDGGEFEIAIGNLDYVLNVGIEKANTDKEGTTVNLYKSTDHISQIFRVALTDEGTYRIYSSASNGGYNRVLGFTYKGYAALFSPSSKYASTFIFRKVENGYQIIPYGQQDKVLGVYKASNGATVSLCDATDSSALTVWKLNDCGTANEEGYEYAIFPTNYIYITQTRYEKYSHSAQNATDFALQYDTDYAYAPFSGSIVATGTYAQCNYVYFVSNTPVIWADGTVDYMTVIFMHDNDISDLTVGQHIRQGEAFYNEGTAGYASGKHIHIAILRGKQNTTTHPWDGDGDVNLEKALFLPKNAKEIELRGVSFVRLPD